MAEDLTLTDTQLLANMPRKLANRARGPGDLNRVHTPTQRNAFARHRADALRAATRMLDGGLVFNDPTGAQDITSYIFDHTAGIPLVGGVATSGQIGAGVDQELIGAAPDIDTFALDGSPAALLTADGKTYELVIVACLKSGSPVLRGVVGAEADDGQELVPTDAQIAAALEAGDATISGNVFLVLARIKIQRVAVDTITYTHTDEAGDAQLIAERAYGNAGTPVS